MIPCKHCNALNSLDSTFCKRCGTGLPADDLKEARARLEKIVEEGTNALNLGRIDEAMAIAESAVASDPSMVSALSLKAACHERRGQIAEALECAEKIVDLNPDSELDKIKRNQLRSALMASASAHRPPSRGVALVAAFSVIVMIVCAGVLVAHSEQPTGNKLVADRGPVKFDPSEVASQPLQIQNQPAQGPTGGNQIPEQPSGATAQSTPSQSDPGSQTGTDSSNLPRLRNPGPTLPPTDVTDTTGDIGPAQVDVPPGSLQPKQTGANTSNAGGSGNTGGSNTVGPAPQVDEDHSDTVQAPPKPANPGTIEISVSSGSPRQRGGGSTPVGSAPDSPTVYARAAEQDYQIGNYTAAAAKLEHAIQAGGDQVRLNQRLGQSYANLGRKSDAIAAYMRSVKAAESALNSGQGDSARLKAQRDAAQAALNQLQGG